MVTGLFQFLSAFVAGTLSKIIDSRLMLAMGLTLFGLGCWINGGLTNEAGYWEFFWPQALRGFALTLNTLFQALVVVFFLALLLMPWVGKAAAQSGEASGGH